MNSPGCGGHCVKLNSIEVHWVSLVPYRLPCPVPVDCLHAQEVPFLPGRPYQLAPPLPALLHHWLPGVPASQGEPVRIHHRTPNRHSLAATKYTSATIRAMYFNARCYVSNAVINIQIA